MHLTDQVVAARGHVGLAVRGPHSFVAVSHALRLVATTMSLPPATKPRTKSLSISAGVFGPATTNDTQKGIGTAIHFRTTTPDARSSCGATRIGDSSHVA